MMTLSQVREQMQAKYRWLCYECTCKIGQKNQWQAGTQGYEDTGPCSVCQNTTCRLIEMPEDILAQAIIEKVLTE